MERGTTFSRPSVVQKRPAAKGRSAETTRQIASARPGSIEAFRRQAWGRMLRKVFEVDPLVCPRCLREGRTVEMEIPELGFAIEIGEVTLTECETVNQFKGSKTEPPQFTRGYGLVFGQTERKAISMALVDRALRWEELGEDFVGAPAQDAEFVLYHADNIQATGFLEHIKLPHYVDFQSELELIRKLRREAVSSGMSEAAE